MSNEDAASFARSLVEAKIHEDDEFFNLVGFQTKMKVPEQKRVLQTIPGLENASFARFGSMHRNTFINGPRHLHPTFQTKRDERIFFAGEATHESLWGTVNGAWESGERAADAVLKLIGRR